MKRRVGFNGSQGLVRFGPAVRALVSSVVALAMVRAETAAAVDAASVSDGDKQTRTATTVVVRSELQLGRERSAISSVDIFIALIRGY